MTLLDKKRQHTVIASEAKQSPSFAPNHVSRTVLRVLRFAAKDVVWFRPRDSRDIKDKSQTHTSEIPGGSRIRGCRVARRLVPAKKVTRCGCWSFVGVRSKFEGVAYPRLPRYARNDEIPWSCGERLSAANRLRSGSEARNGRWLSGANRPRRGSEARNDGEKSGLVRDSRLKPKRSRDNPLRTEEEERHLRRQPRTPASK